MKEVKKAVAALVVAALSLGIGHFTGLLFGEFIGSMEFNFLSLLKVLAVVGTLMAVKSLLKLCLSAVKKESTLLTILRSLLDYTAVILAIIWSLRILGADINGIIAGLGILGLVIGMSAQDLINDLLTGLFLLFEQEYKVGDIIEHLNVVAGQGNGRGAVFHRQQPSSAAAALTSMSSSIVAASPSPTGKDDKIKKKGD